MENAQELWQLDANGKIFDTNLTELTTWIGEGAVLRMDRVRKGNLRWIEAGKVPSLLAFFNAYDAGQPIPPVVTITSAAEPATQVVEPDAGKAFVSPEPVLAADDVPPPPSTALSSTEPVCSMHSDVPAAYVCETCGNSFCKTCPNSYGGNVKICPFCGAMCTSLSKVIESRQRENVRHSAGGDGFGFGDFGRAIAYPFRFKTSLIMGAIMFMFFSIGQSAMSFGGIFLLAAAIMCFMLTNMLTFGILAHTTENFSQGNLDVNFMPSFDEFSLWDDVVHPFFLSIGVYISSFGPLIAVALLAFFLVVGTVSKEMNGARSDAARLTNPEMPYATNAVSQAEKMREMVKTAKDFQQKRAEQIQKGEIERDQMPNNLKDPEEEYFERTNKMIQDTRKAQLESAVGKTPETVAKEREDLVKRIIGYGALFILLFGITLLWGLFYFPAACAVAGYTRSFTATLNPFVGFDTIKRLGLDYVKILAMGLLISLAGIVIGGVLGILFMAFNLPGVGNLPAKAIGSLFSFYLWIVFSCVLGFALFKRADKLGLVSA